MLALGMGALSASIFHLFTHAFFKALLFLGAGSISHSTGTFDMNKMGGLRKIMPWTYVTFIIGSLSLLGIFPLSGFWSKDEILSGAWSNSGIVSNIAFYLAFITVFITSFYMFRAFFMIFNAITSFLNISLTFTTFPNVPSPKVFAILNRFCRISPAEYMR